MLASNFPCVLRLVVIVALLAVGASAAMAHPPWGIVFSSTGIVYFSDLETVWKIDRDGNLSVFRAGVGGRHVHELSIDDQDNLYGPVEVYEARTEKYLIGVWRMTPDGKETQLQHPIDIVMSGVSIGGIALATCTRSTRTTTPKNEHCFAAHGQLAQFQRWQVGLTGIRMAKVPPQDSEASAQ